jgi:hypothetical protein
MGKKRLTEMSGEEFEAVIETHIGRESANMGEIDAPLFYEDLGDIFAAKPKTVELEGRIEGSRLQLHPAGREVPGVRVHGNEIVVNGIRFVIRLASAEQ